jgi:heptosyltransferase III
LRILLIKRDKLGDLLLSTPVFAHLKSVLPDAQIHLLANDYNAWVARGHPALARTWEYPRVQQAGRMRLGAALAQIPLAWQLRRQRFDWAIVLGGDETHRGVRRAIGTGAARVVAYAKDPKTFGPRLTDPLPPPVAGHEIARMFALLAPLGVAPPATWSAPTFSLPEVAATFARGWLADRGLAPGRFVVLGLGARRAKKQPTTEQIARWSTRWKTQYGLDTVFMWTPGAADKPDYPGDDAIAQPLLALQLPHVHPFRGPIKEALGLIFNAKSSVFPDSGLMHFAAASPGGVLGLFADPVDSAPASRWAPVGPRALHIEAVKTVSELPDEMILAKLAPLLAP